MGDLPEPADHGKPWLTSFLVGLFTAIVCGTLIFEFGRPRRDVWFGVFGGWESHGMEDPQKRLDWMHRTRAVPLAVAVALLVGGLGARLILTRRWPRACWLVLGIVSCALSMTAASPWCYNPEPHWTAEGRHDASLVDAMVGGGVAGAFVGLILGAVLYAMSDSADKPAE